MAEATSILESGCGSALCPGPSKTYAHLAIGFHSLGTGLGQHPDRDRKTGDTVPQQQGCKSMVRTLDLCLRSTPTCGSSDNWGDGVLGWTPKLQILIRRQQGWSGKEQPREGCLSVREFASQRDK